MASKKLKTSAAFGHLKRHLRKGGATKVVGAGWRRVDKVADRNVGGFRFELSEPRAIFIVTDSLEIIEGVQVG